MKPPKDVGNTTDQNSGNAELPFNKATKDPEAFGKPASEFKNINEGKKSEQSTEQKGEQNTEQKGEQKGEEKKPEKPKTKREMMLEAAKAEQAKKSPEIIKAEAEAKALVVKAESEAQVERIKMENELLMSTPEGRQILLNERLVKGRIAMANKLFAAGCFTTDVHNAEQAFVKIQAGYEMGMTEMRAMNGLYIVNGKVTVWGQETSRRLKEHGWELFYENESDDGVTVKIKNSKTGKEYKETVNKNEKQLANSRAMGFAPKNKMRFYGLAQLIKFHAPEVLNGHEITENVIDMPPIEDQAREAGIEQTLDKKEQLRKLKTGEQKGEEKRNVIDNDDAQ